MKIKYLIKDKCVCCGAKKTTRYEHYKKYGNYCVRCVMKATQLVETKNKINYLNKVLEDHKEQEEIIRQIKLAQKKKSNIIESLPQYKDIDFIKLLDVNY